MSRQQPQSLLVSVWRHASQGDPKGFKGFNFEPTHPQSPFFAMYSESALEIAAENPERAAEELKKITQAWDGLPTPEAVAFLVDTHLNWITRLNGLAQQKRQALLEERKELGEGEFVSTWTAWFRRKNIEVPMNHPMLSLGAKPSDLIIATITEPHYRYAAMQDRVVEALVDYAEKNNLLQAAKAIAAREGMKFSRK